MACQQLPNEKLRSFSIMNFNLCLFGAGWGIRSGRLMGWFMLHLWAIKLNVCDILNHTATLLENKIPCRQVEVNRLFVQGSRKASRWYLYRINIAEKFTGKSKVKPINFPFFKARTHGVEKQTSHTLRLNKSDEQPPKNFFVLMKNCLICNEINFLVYEKRSGKANMTESDKFTRSRATGSENMNEIRCN